MGPKKKKANKAREEYLEKKKLEREEAAAAKAQQGEGQGGQGDQGAAAVEPELVEAPLTAPAAGGATPPSPMERQLSQLSLKAEGEKPPPRHPPSTAGTGAALSKAKYKVASFPHGSRVGKDGRKVGILVNHFPMRVTVKTVHRYDVKVESPEWPKGRAVRKSDKDMLVRAFEELKRGHSDKFPKPHAVVYDGQFLAYSTDRLFKTGTSKGEVDIKVVADLEDSTIKLRFALTHAGEVDVRNAFADYGTRGTTLTRPFEATQVVNTILNYLTTVRQKDFITHGRTIFKLSTPKGVADIGGGKSLWTGVFTSVRPAWSIFFNVDMANKPAYEEQPMLDFVAKFLYPNAQKVFSAVPSADGQKLQIDCEVFDFQRKANVRKKWEVPLDRRAISNLSKELKGLKVRFHRPDNAKRDYRVNEVGPPVHVPVQMGGDKKMSVGKYMQEEYRHQLKYPKGLTLQVGNPAKNILWPMELVKLKKQPCPRSKELTGQQTAKMIRHTAVKPQERMKNILEGLRPIGKDDYARAFGISIEDKFKQVAGRILDPPRIGYKKQDGKPIAAKIEMGKWNMPQSSNFVTGMELKRWGVLCLARVDDRTWGAFEGELIREGKSCGITVHSSGDNYIQSKADSRSNTYLGDVERDFEALLKKVKGPKGQPPQLIMVLADGPSPATSQARNRIKLLGDAILNIPTQFILTKNLKPNNSHMILLKINSKLGGTNQIMNPSSLPSVLRSCPVMVMGADVTHAAPQHQGEKPSIVAVVASTEPAACNMSQYGCEVRLQTPKKVGGNQVVEEIVNMQDIAKKLLENFYQKSNGRKPDKIIYYRDGVSEGQFEDILNLEMTAIQRACKQLDKDYEPGITFVVAQKRHKTRMFPAEPRTGDKNGNVVPGTVVDTEITNPTEDSFFLASHEAIQGTTKPTGYHLLWDDNKLSPDELQSLTYYLCHMYARCQRSVSYPAPTYYAHLAAFRAREHHDAILAKTAEEGWSNDRRAEEEKKIQHFQLLNFFI